MAKNKNRANTKEAALLAMMSGTTVCLRGETGVGKTHMMRQIAKETGRELIVLDAAIQSTEDLIGYPYRENDVMKWAKPDWFPSAAKGKKYLMFIDELNRASREVINSLMPLLLEGTMHTHKLPEDTWVACAINPDSVGYDAVSGIEDRAVWARMCIVNVTPDPDDWGDWLKNEKLNTDLNKDLIKEFKRKLVSSGGLEVVQYPNNRSFTKVLNMLNLATEVKGTPKAFSKEAIEKACIGILGTGLYGEVRATLLASYDNTDMPTVDELLKDIDEKNIVSGVSYFVRIMNSENVLTLKEVKGILNMMIQYNRKFPDQIKNLQDVFHSLDDRDDYIEILDNREVINLRNQLNV